VIEDEPRVSRESVRLGEPTSTISDVCPRINRIPASSTMAFTLALGRDVLIGMYVIPDARSVTLATTDSIDLSMDTPTT
jgi:hypothetical protein